MANIMITTCDSGGIALEGEKFRDDTLLFGAADTLVAGTILARKLVSDTITTAITGTGTRALTAAAVAGRTLATGAWTILAGTLSSGVGTWTCTAPSGETETCTTSAAGGDLLFPRLGLSVVVAETGTNYVTGDSIAVTVAAQSGTPLVVFATAGVNGAQVPVAVLTYPITVAAGGSFAARVLVAGEVNKNRLVIDADGTGANVTDAILDALCSQGIVATVVDQLSALDNGAS
jgi:hypothetical protein